MLSRKEVLHNGKENHILFGKSCSPEKFLELFHALLHDFRFRASTECDLGKFVLPVLYQEHFLFDRVSDDEFDG